jgi:hypothetical protein
MAASRASALAARRSRKHLVVAAKGSRAAACAASVVDDASRRHDRHPRARRDVDVVDELPVHSVVAPVDRAEPQAAVEGRRDVEAGAVELDVARSPVV